MQHANKDIYSMLSIGYIFICEIVVSYIRNIILNRGPTVSLTTVVDSINIITFKFRAETVTLGFLSMVA